ncbi:MAG: AmmeMemoRadiSam system protein A [Formivibrio sp.]|nr:AmmeMemoRadiSam system protein A [Formivibrio sp.]
MKQDALGKELLHQARAAIEEALGGSTCPPPADLQELKEPGATFVTLTKQGQLRGCIGSLQAHRPLIADVRANAVAAALNDPRFYSLETNELKQIKVEVSLILPPEDLPFSDEDDLLQKLVPYVDGVIISSGTHRATFLPQVWEQLPDPKQFISHLKQKSGLPSDTPMETFSVQRYRAQKWKEA